jgi:hypothetical protein
MGWLIATIVLMALVYFTIVSPGFRYLIIAIVVLGGLAITAGSKRRIRTMSAARKSRLRKSELR